MQRGIAFWALEILFLVMVAISLVLPLDRFDGKASLAGLGVVMLFTAWQMYRQKVVDWRKDFFRLRGIATIFLSFIYWFTGALFIVGVFMPNLLEAYKYWPLMLGIIVAFLMIVKARLKKLR